ncbi:YcjF family protein [Vulcanococcus limneticus]|uniref:YcjF family protein n=1 Tax=Vulcanococcus limneticus TaxID=2170428 RepID=UPI00398C1474
MRSGPLGTGPVEAVLRPALPALRRWWPVGAAVLGGGWLLGDSLHLSLSSVVALSAAAGGLWLLNGRSRPVAPRLPASSQGWLSRCEAVLTQFELLEGAESPALPGRRAALAALQARQERRHLDLALVGCDLPDPQLQALLAQACRAPLPVRLHWGLPLPATSPSWQWPELFERCDHLLYCLPLPLRASDLRWLEALPGGQSVWLLVERGEEVGWLQRQQELEGQLPERLRQRWLAWNPASRDGTALAEALAPLAAELGRGGPLQLERTHCRCLEQLHGRWQLELEALRRARWQALVTRTQWTVAAGVVVAPLPSLDLLVLAAANGLMLQEMAKLWNCDWSAEQLQAAARELAKAALTLGVVEWSSQALASLIKLHGATWLVGGALQALSAAYLTRVVGRAMADYLALASGVPEDQLAALLQRQAPLLVARAAEEERHDWAGFLEQGRRWWRQQALAAGAT